MTNDWVTLPLEQLVKARSHGDGMLAIRQCRLCPTQTVPSTEQTVDEQIRVHLERDHLAVAETQTTRVGARMRAKFIAMGWTPPADDGPGRSADPDERPTQPPAEDEGRGR